MCGPLTLDLLRHGACRGGAIWRGRTDSPLSDVGWQQLEAATDGVEGWQRVWCSPLQRCRGFAERLAKTRGLPLVTDPRLREYDFGDWDGQSRDRVWQRDAQRVAAFWEDPEHCPPPGGEPFVQFRGRLSRFANELAGAGGEHWLVVTHGGVIRLLLTELLAIPLELAFRLQIDPASLTRLQLYPKAASETGDGPDRRPWYPQLVFLNRLNELCAYE